MKSAADIVQECADKYLDIIAKDFDFRTNEVARLAAPANEGMWPSLLTQVACREIALARKVVIRDFLNVILFDLRKEGYGVVGAKGDRLAVFDHPHAAPPQARDPERALRDERDLKDLAEWLSYGRTSGYKAARCSEEQELHWAGLLRKLLEERG